MGIKDLSKRVSAQTADIGRKQQACCTSPSTMCYWCTTSLGAWGLFSLLGLYWHPLHASSAATILFAASVGCFANWVKHRTFHCAITAWLFLAAAGLFLLANIGLIAIEPRFIWPVVAIGTVVAFLLEWRYASRPTR